MHWLEGVIMMAAGVIPWLIATERLPADPASRRELEIRMPWMKHKKLLWGMAVFLWVFGLAAASGLVR